MNPLQNVRPHERERFGFFLSLSFLLSFGLTLGLVATESLILSVWGAEYLPLNFVMSSIATVLGSLIYAFGVDQEKNDRYFIWLLLFFAALIFALSQALTVAAWPVLALGSLYFLTFAVLNNHYWTFTGDFFDTLSAKRLFPLFLVGNSLGGFAGGLLVTAGLSAQVLLPIWAATFALTAAFIRLYRRSLRRWGPLELEESDETSLDAMRNALLYLRQSRLGKCMAAACIALIFSLFIAQFLYSQLFSSLFTDQNQLTLFFGRLLAITNLVEVVVESALTPLLISRFGVANANLLHPALTLVSFTFLSWQSNLYTAVACRLNRETLDNALGGPIRNLVYNALPDRFRGRLRALLEGIVVYSGMALAGTFLMLTSGRLSTFQLTLCGLGASLAYLAAHQLVRQAYLDSLVSELRAGRLDLSDVGSHLAGFEIERLGQLWEALTHEASLSPTNPHPVAQRFVYTLASRQVHQPLFLACREDHPAWLRRTCVEALGAHLLPQNDLVVHLLADSDLNVVRTTLQTLFEHQQNWQAPINVGPILSKLSVNLDSRVRSLALALNWLHLASEHSHTLLRQMALGEDFQEAICALSCLDLADQDLLLSKSQDAPLLIRKTCFERLAVIWAQRSAPLDILPLIKDALGDSDVQIRLAVLRLMLSLSWNYPLPINLSDGSKDLAVEPDDLVSDLILQAFALFADPYPEVRRQIARFLSGFGEDILSIKDGRWNLGKSKKNQDFSKSDLGQRLQSDHPETLETALQVLALQASSSARGLLATQLRTRVHQVWYLRCAHKICSEPQPILEETLRLFLSSTLRDYADRELKLAFKVLSFLEDPKIMGSVEKVLRFSSLRARADALEVLSNLGDREAAKLLVLLLEDDNWSERINQLPPSVKLPENLADVLEWLRQGTDPWFKLVNSHLAVSLPTTNTGIIRLKNRQTKELQFMERLLVLRKVPLFAQMSLDQLDAINQLLKELQYIKGEVLINEGDLGDELYILVEGSVRILKGRGTAQELELNKMSGVSYFGEMSILDDEPRSASVVADTDCSLLVLRGEQLKILIHQLPEIAFEIFKVLTARIRQGASSQLKSGPVKT